MISDKVQTQNRLEKTNAIELVVITFGNFVKSNIDSYDILLLYSLGKANFEEMKTTLSRSSYAKILLCAFRI